MDTIVVGLDSSPRAPHVLAEAVELAKRFGARLYAVRGVGLPVEVPHEALEISPDALATRLRDAGAAQLEKLVAAVPKDVPTQTEAHFGTPWQAIIDVAEREKARFVVVGSHGHGAIDRLLGTTATRVVHHATCTVVVVRC